MTELHLTNAQKRVLKKARDESFIMIYGAFSGAETGFDTKFAQFDRRMHIEALIGKKLLTLGTGFNQYVLTEAGAMALKPKREQRVAA